MQYNSLLYLLLIFLDIFFQNVRPTSINSAIQSRNSYGYSIPTTRLKSTTARRLRNADFIINREVWWLSFIAMGGFFQLTFRLHIRVQFHKTYGIGPKGLTDLLEKLQIFRSIYFLFYGTILYWFSIEFLEVQVQLRLKRSNQNKCQIFRNDFVYAKSDIRTIIKWLHWIDPTSII